VHFVDFDTWRRLMGSSTIRVHVLKPHQVPVYRAYIIPLCSQEEIMKTKLFCLRVGKPRSSVTLPLCFIDWYNTACPAAANPIAAVRSSGRVIGRHWYPSARLDPWIRISRCWPVLHYLIHYSLSCSVWTDTVQPVPFYNTWYSTACPVIRILTDKLQLLLLCIWTL
jgi:hypothetical protein